MHSWKTAKNLFTKTVLLTWLLPATVFAGDIIDATGASVSVSDSPKKIVTLVPSLAELAADIAEENIGRIVGVSEYSDYPPALEKVESIGPYFHFNLEKVVSLKPDLVLGTMDGNSKDQVMHLRELKLPVVIVSTENFAQVEDSMRIVSDAMGASSRAAQMITQFRTGLSRIRERASERAKKNSGKKLKVLLQIGADPLVVAGRKSFLNEALETIGAVNAYGDVEARYPRPSMEDVIKRGPDLIVVLALGRKKGPFQAMARDWGRFKNIPAVKRKQVFIVVADPLFRPTLRLLEGLSMLEKIVEKNINAQSQNI
ncbi:MAG: helical backbone metal receptor [Bdellovibrionota bacterium]